jgi:hypothetical protein
MVDEKSKLERTIATQPNFIDFMIHKMRGHKYKEFNDRAKQNGMDYSAYICHLMIMEDMIISKVIKE